MNAVTALLKFGETDAPATDFRLQPRIPLKLELASELGRPRPREGDRSHNSVQSYAGLQAAKSSLAYLLRPSCSGQRYDIRMQLSRLLRQRFHHELNGVPQHELLMRPSSLALAGQARASRAAGLVDCLWQLCLTAVSDSAGDELETIGRRLAPGLWLIYEHLLTCCDKGGLPT